MKKTLIAIAALAATGAFAQSTVTISGVVDMAFMNSSAQVAPTAEVLGAAAVVTAATGTVGTTGYKPESIKAAVAGAAAKAGGDLKTSTFDRNGSSTSALFIRGEEDLGGGMKAAFHFESAWNPANGATSAFANAETFLGLSGGFGGIKLGSPNSAILQTALTGDAFGTAVGGSYTGRFSRTGNGVGTRVIRNANSARYDSPVLFGGLTASYEFAFSNKDLAGTNVTTAGVNVLGLRYAAGPLTVAFANGNTTSVGTVADDTKTSQNLLSANYVMGAATVYGGYTTYKATTSTATTDQTSSMNLAVKYAVSGTTSVMASMAKRTDKTTAGANGSLMGLGADYSMSKRTTAYARYETLDSNKASDTTGKGSTLALGIKHTF